MQHVFYVRVTADGGSQDFFGPYTLEVGCTSTSVVLTDNPAFILDVPKWVGDPLTNIYNFALPTADRAWCVILSNVIVNLDGSAWTLPAKFDDCSPQPCNVYDLVSTTYPEVVTFKVKTTFTNTQEQVSPQATITITCGNFYDILESGPTSGT